MAGRVFFSSYYAGILQTVLENRTNIQLREYADDHFKAGDIQAEEEAVNIMEETLVNVGEWNHDNHLSSQ